MKKILWAAAVCAVLASCASTPAAPPKPAPAAPPATPAPAPAPAAAKVITYEDAYPTVVKSFYPNGDPSSTVTAKYDANGRLLSQDTLNGNGVLVESRVGKAKGSVWRITVASGQSGEVASLEDRTFGPTGELLVQTFLNPKEQPQASNEFTYNALGQKVLWVARTGAGDLQAKTVYTYDEKGNNVRSEVYDGGGKLTNVFESTFDDQNHLTLRKGFDASKNLVEQTAFTWKDGAKVKEETTKPLLRTIEYTYAGHTAPATIASSVRGKLVERQSLEYFFVTRTKTVTP